MHVVMVGDFPRRHDKIEGGVEAVTTYLANALQAYSDITVDAVTLDRWGGAARSERQRSINVHFVPVSHRPSRLSNRQNIRRLRDTIIRLKPDIVHAHIANQFAEAAARTGAPWILTAHGIRHLEMALRPGIVNRYRRFLVSREEHRVVQSASHIISISPFVTDVFKGHINGEVTMLDNPVDDSFFNVARQPNGASILYVGRLIPRKDVLTLLKSFNRVRAQIPNARLRLAGEGISGREPSGYPGRLSEYIESKGLGGSVGFLGQLNDEELQKEYSRCSLMAVSSILETAPMVILQAMAAGVPVVSTDTGGIKYLIDDGRSGYVLPVGDDEGLAAAMLEIIKNSDLAAAMGAVASATANKRFRASVVADKTRQLYFKAVGVKS